MSRASNLAGFSTSIQSVAPNNLVVGVITATRFVGNGSGLTGVANTDFVVSTATTTGALTVTGTATLSAANITNNATVGGALTVTGNFTVNGTQTIINTTTLDITDKTVGIASTASPTDSYANGAGIVIYGTTNKTLTWDNGNSRMAFSTNVYAPKYFGDGSSLTGISAGGIGTEAATPSGAVVTLDLSKQDHKVTATGIVTVTCSGGTEGDSHTVRIVNSGIATVGFSTFFLFPSGSPPVLPTTSGAISIISFTVHRVGTAGTQLLAGASLNFS